MRGFLGQRPPREWRVTSSPHREAHWLLRSRAYPRQKQGTSQAWLYHLERKKWRLSCLLDPQKDGLGLRGSHSGNDRTSYLPGWINS